jgi:hypothetical protein
LITLQQTGLDWNAIIQEYEAQIKGRKVEKNLFKKLSNLKKEGVTNPLIKKLITV